MFVNVKAYLHCMPRGKNFTRNTYHVRDFRLYTCKQEVYFEIKMQVSFSLSLKLAGIEHKVQAGMFVSQISLHIRRV